MKVEETLSDLKLLDIRLKVGIAYWYGEEMSQEACTWTLKCSNFRVGTIHNVFVGLRGQAKQIAG
jgi:hypothetical protein